MQYLFVGVDTGGTFTDFVLLHEGKVRIHKVLSTPHDPAQAILQGLHDLAITDDLKALVHGSTVATNAVLEQKGVRTGLIMTAGFRDILEIGRQTRPKLYDFKVLKVAPLVPRSLRAEVVERLNERGEVLTPLDVASVQAVVESLQASGIEAIAVSLLFSFTNPAHERTVAEMARAAGFYVSASYEIVPEFREYERTSTVVLNAYVGPLIDRYLARLEEALPKKTALRIMQSNGGSISSATARREAARTLLSGPAAGVVGAAFVAEASGFKQAITIDMGGTSTDVALVDGRITEAMNGQIGSYPVKLPMIDIHTIGAGGGSMAWFDTGGALRVGPRSAGADPGPAAYGRGGMKATVTDANVVLGRLLPEAFLGGTMTLHVEQARAAMTVIATRLNTTSEDAALGIVRIINAHMEAAIRVISVEKGFDPRRFVLVAFGGAGPLHACEVATALQIPRVLIPTTPGVLSAFGMLTADVIKDYVRTVMLPEADAQEPVRLIVEELEAQGRVDLVREGFSSERIVLERFLDLRYVGQSYELVIPLADRAVGTTDRAIGTTQDNVREAIGRFHVAHARRFGYSDPTEPVQIVNIRVKARGMVVRPALERRQGQEDATLPQPLTTRSVIFGEKNRAISYDTPVYARETLPVQSMCVGPAIITQYDTTTILPPGWQATVDPVGNLIAERVESAGNDHE
jgi:N-methylhydantoinase A